MGFNYKTPPICRRSTSRLLFAKANQNLAVTQFGVKLAFEETFHDSLLVLNGFGLRYRLVFWLTVSMECSQAQTRDEELDLQRSFNTRTQVFILDNLLKEFKTQFVLLHPFYFIGVEGHLKQLGKPIWTKETLSR